MNEIPSDFFTLKLIKKVEQTLSKKHCELERFHVTWNLVSSTELEFDAVCVYFFGR